MAKEKEVKKLKKEVELLDDMLFAVVELLEENFKVRRMRK